jgi:signal transduction histidine kinase
MSLKAAYLLIALFGCTLVVSDFPTGNLGSPLISELGAPIWRSRLFADVAGCLCVSLFSLLVLYSYRLATRQAKVLVVFQLFTFAAALSFIAFRAFGESGTLPGLIAVLALGSYLGLLARRIGQNQELLLLNNLERQLRTRDLQEAKLKLIRLDETDRRLLAGDLHDQVLQDLKSVNQILTDLGKRSTMPEVELARRSLLNGMKGIREVMEALHPSILNDVGLSAAFEEVVRQASSRKKLKTRINNKAAHLLEELDLVEQTIIYRLVQEAVNNICRHAEASTITVSSSSTDDMLLLEIIDDGKGLPERAVRTESRGMIYMKQRAAIIGAQISWQKPASGKGTAVKIVLGRKRTANA